MFLLVFLSCSCDNNFFIAIKNYTVRRVIESIQHQMTPTITLDDVFTKCRINNATKLVKQRARETIDKIFSHLQSKAAISSFQWRKNDGKFDAVTFTYTKAKKTASESE
jgi:hypothetical protein